MPTPSSNDFRCHTPPSDSTGKVIAPLYGVVAEAVVAVCRSSYRVTTLRVWASTNTTGMEVRSVPSRRGWRTCHTSRSSPLWRMIHSFVVGSSVASPSRSATMSMASSRVIAGRVST